eukprot:Partr_v1_DN28404_c3_g1_i1_m41216 putative leucine rich repeat containing
MKFLLAIIVAAIFWVELTLAKPFLFSFCMPDTILQEYNKLVKGLHKNLPHSSYSKKKAELQNFITENISELYREVLEVGLESPCVLGKEILYKFPEFSKIVPPSQMHYSVLELYNMKASELHQSSTSEDSQENESQLEEFIKKNAGTLYQECREVDFVGVVDVQSLLDNPTFAKLMAQDPSYSQRYQENLYTYDKAVNRHSDLTKQGLSLIEQYNRISGDLRRFSSSRSKHKRAVIDLRVLLEKSCSLLFAEFKNDESAFLDAMRDDYLLNDPLFSELLTRNGKRGGFHLWDPSIAIIKGGTWDVTDWRRFVALKRAVKVVDVFDAFLSTEEWEFLRKALSGAQQLEVLHFTRVKFSHEERMKLRKIQVISLKALILSENDLGPTGLTDLTPWMISSLQSAESLTIANNNIDDGIENLAEILLKFNSLLNLNLSGNGISAQGLKLLQSALSGMHNLETLRLYKNNLGKGGLRVILMILPSLTNLKLLNISDNNLEARDVIKLMKNVASLRLYNLRVVHGLKASDFDHNEWFTLKMEYWYVDFDKSPGSFKFDPDYVHEFERQSSISSNRLSQLSG